MLASWEGMWQDSFSCQSVQGPAGRLQGNHEPPSIFRCVEAFQQFFFTFTRTLQGFVFVFVCETFAEDKPDGKSFLRRLSKFFKIAGARGRTRQKKLEAAPDSSASTVQPLRFSSGLDASRLSSRGSPMSWKGCGKMLGNFAIFPTNKQGN